MLDPKLIRTDIAAVAAQLKRRGYDLDEADIESLEVKRKQCQVKTEQLQSERNSKSKSIGKAKAAGETLAGGEKLVEPPRMIKMVEPAYPTGARAEGVEGTVVLVVVVVSASVDVQPGVSSSNPAVLTYTWL